MWSDAWIRLTKERMQKVQPGRCAPIAQPRPGHASGDLAVGHPETRQRARGRIYEVIARFLQNSMSVNRYLWKASEEVHARNIPFAWD